MGFWYVLNQDNSTLSLLGFSYAAEGGFFVCPRALHDVAVQRRDLAVGELPVDLAREL